MRMPVRVLGLAVLAGILCGDARTRSGGAGPAPVVRNSKDGAEMVYVAPGTFMMGSERADDEKPVRQVTLTRGFRLYRTEVTNAQYRLFLIANPKHPRPLFWKDRRFNAPAQPVVGVSWSDAMAYCRWARCRLPTEAEWEYAARGSDARTYPWGEQEPDAARAIFDRHPATAGPGPVGRLAGGASPCGARDMAGNVWEWCADWYAPYRPGNVTDPRGPAGGSERVMRGGGWNNEPRHLRTAYRGYGEPVFQHFNLGFRPARSE